MKTTRTTTTTRTTRTTTTNEYDDTDRTVRPPEGGYPPRVSPDGARPEASRMSTQLCLILVTAFTVLNAVVSVLIHIELRQSSRDEQDQP